MDAVYEKKIDTLGTFTFTQKIQQQLFKQNQQLCKKTMSKALWYTMDTLPARGRRLVSFNKATSTVFRLP